MTDDWLAAVEVEGRSMTPALRPGDRLLIEQRTYRRRAPLPGEIVIVVDPRQPQRELIKRVAAVADGAVELRGDAADHSTDSRIFGPLPLTSVTWRAAFRYWPPWRAGRVSRRR